MGDFNQIVLEIATYLLDLGNNHIPRILPR